MIGTTQLVSEVVTITYQRESKRAMTAEETVEPRLSEGMPCIVSIRVDSLAVTDKTPAPERKKISLAALRRAIASSTALETGQNIQELERKLNAPAKHRFAPLKLAD